MSISPRFRLAAATVLHVAHVAYVAPRGRLPTLAVAISWLALSACAAEPKRPPPGGDCVPTPSTPCSPAGGGGGGSSSAPADGGSNEDAIASTESDASGSCTLIPAANPTCQPCLDTNCAASCLACTGDCALLVTCTLACTQNNPTCANDCEARYATATVAYGDFANCVQSNCSACPTPLLGTVADL